MKQYVVFESVSACAGAVFGFLFGAADGLLYALIALSLLDYATGTAVAVLNKTLSSKTGFRGICKKFLLYALVAAANVIDVQVLGGTAALRSAAIFLFIGNEGISIVENAAAMGLPVPEKLKRVLKQLHDKGDDDGEN